jgi:hypothetical protein
VLTKNGLVGQDFQIICDAVHYSNARLRPDIGEVSTASPAETRSHKSSHFATNDLSRTLAPSATAG